MTYLFNVLWKKHTNYQVHRPLVKLEKVVASSKTQYMLGSHILMTSDGKAVRLIECFIPVEHRIAGKGDEVVLYKGRVKL